MAEHIAETLSGKIRGYERNGLVEYLGIPFAEPPVGALRFKRAVPKAPWLDIFDAKEYGPEAVQFDEGRQKGSEDCLTLNIQRPMVQYRRGQCPALQRRFLCQGRHRVRLHPVPAERAWLL